MIYLTQNLFPQGKASRDIALNCHYLVLFNNPVDRQQISLLARRIQPSTPERFMKVYEAAVDKPYGNLLIDLKANTPERERLKPNVLEQTSLGEKKMPVLQRETSMETEEDDTDTDEEMPVLQPEENVQRGGAALYYTEYPPPWYQQQQRGRGLKRKIERQESEEEDKKSSITLWKRLFMPIVIEKIREDIDKRVEEYIEEGTEADKANVLAYNEHLPEMRRLLMQQYLDFELHSLALERDWMNQLIQDTAQRLNLEYRMGDVESMKKATEMRIYLMDDILSYKEDI